MHTCRIKLWFWNKLIAITFEYFLLIQLFSEISITMQLSHSKTIKYFKFTVTAVTATFKCEWQVVT